MESLAIPAQTIESANRKLDLLIHSLQSAEDSFSVSSERMATALVEVVRIGEWLREYVPPSADGHLSKELEGYRQRLERLRDLLPDLHGRLLTERSRLESERSHLELAATWAHSAGR